MELEVANWVAVIYPDRGRIRSKEMLGAWFRMLGAWFRAYENLQSLALVLLYSQVACALIGSLGAYYTGLLVANLVISLFAAVGIQSESQALGKTSGILLVCALLLDITWQFSVHLNAGKFTAFSLQLVLWIQIAGFLLRLMSAFFWLQMSRLGFSSYRGGLYQPLDLEGRNSGIHQSSLSDEVLSGSIYNPAYYASFFGSPDEVLPIKDVN